MKKILWQSAFWMINKELAREIWLESTLLLSDLIDKEEYFKEKNELDNEWYFFNISDNLEKDLQLSYKIQLKCFKILETKDFIKIKRKWIPAKKYFKINEDKILDFLYKKDKTSIDKKETTDMPKRKNKSSPKVNCINKNKKIIINNNINNSKELVQSTECEKINEDKRDFEIELIIETIKNINMWLIDDPVNKQRQYASLLKTKILKLHWFNWDYVWLLNMLYEKSDEFKKHHFRSIEKIYWNLAWIVSWIRKEMDKIKELEKRRLAI